MVLIRTHILVEELSAIADGRPVDLKSHAGEITGDLMTKVW